MKYFILILFLSFSLSNFGQNNCGTPEPQDYTYFSKKEIQEEISSLKHVTRNDPRVFMLSIHIVKNNNGGEGIKKSFVHAAIAKLNDHYATANIEFQVCGEFHDVKNSKYLETDPDEGLELTLLNNIKNTINIYFIPSVVNSNNESICGNATFPSTSIDRRRIFMDNDCVTNGSTLSHEMGHFFNLLHTHSTYFGEERVARIGCSSSGDGFCDTPADPRLSSETIFNCVYLAAEEDSFGDTYTPDVNNLMSYAPKVCRESFTDEQIAMISLTANGDNSYHKHTCTQQDFKVSNSYTNGIIVNDFESNKVKFSISNPTFLAETTVPFIVYMVNDSDNSKAELLRSSIDFTEENQSHEIEVDIPFSDTLVNYKSVEFYIDNLNLFEELDENNNYSSVELSYNFSFDQAQFLFPNPALDFVTLYRSDNYLGSLKTVLYDMTGKVLFSESIGKASKFYFHKIDLMNILPGAYYLQVFDDNGNYEILKFIRL